MGVAKKFESSLGYPGLYSLLRERTKRRDLRLREPNGNVDRPIYSINDDSIPIRKKSDSSEEWRQVVSASDAMLKYL